MTSNDRVEFLVDKTMYENGARVSPTELYGNLDRLVRLEPGRRSEHGDAPERPAGSVSER